MQSTSTEKFNRNKRLIAKTASSSTACQSARQETPNTRRKAEAANFERRSPSRRSPSGNFRRPSSQDSKLRHGLIRTKKMHHPHKQTAIRKTTVRGVMTRERRRISTRENMHARKRQSRAAAAAANKSARKAPLNRRAEIPGTTAPNLSCILFKTFWEHFLFFSHSLKKFFLFSNERKFFFLSFFNHSLHISFARKRLGNIFIFPLSLIHRKNSFLFHTFIVKFQIKYLPL